MSSEEFGEWIAFYQHEPFGWQAESFGPALVALMIQHRSLGENEEPLKMEDLMVKDDWEPAYQSADSMKQLAMAYTIALGGTVKEKAK